MIPNLTNRIVYKRDLMAVPKKKSNAKMLIDITIEHSSSYCLIQPS